MPSPSSAHYDDSRGDVRAGAWRDRLTNSENRLLSWAETTPILPEPFGTGMLYGLLRLLRRVAFIADDEEFRHQGGPEVIEDLSTVDASGRAK